jgi:hypothetical protein
MYIKLRGEIVGLSVCTTIVHRSKRSSTVAKVLQNRRLQPTKQGRNALVICV